MIELLDIVASGLIAPEHAPAAAPGSPRSRA